METMNNRCDLTGFQTKISDTLRPVKCLKDFNFMKIVDQLLKKMY